MGELKKATIQEISSDDKRLALGPPVEVQFNPTTLRLQLSNQVSGGETRGQQAVQHMGASTTSLSLELVFDTADLGTTAVPVSVREKTAAVERFLLPKKAGGEAPPKMRFQWASLIVEGIVDSLSLDLDHFAADGTPLRARVSLSIREQDPKYQFLKTGPGSNTQGGAPAPGGLGLGAVGGASLGLGLGLGASLGIGGSVGFSAGLSAQAGLALGGETAAEFSARMGLDPGAWRGLDVDLSAGLSLEAGTEVGFDPDLSAGLGLGTSAGVAAGAAASLEASLGLEPAASAGTPLAAARQSGFALAAAGGLGAAVETAAATRAEEAAGAAKAAFGEAAPGQIGRLGGPPRLGTGGLGGGLAESADRRTTTFGLGVPLRPRFAGLSPAASRPTSGSAESSKSHACSCGCGEKR